MSCTKTNHRKGLAAIYRQEIIHDVTLFTSQGAASFYDKLFSALDFELPRAKTGRTGFPKEAMLCAFIVMKCEGLGYITDLRDYLENNLLIAHYCGFDITKPLPSYWTFERFIKKLDNSTLKAIQASLVQTLYKLGVVDASFIGLDSTPVMANTAQNNPKSFVKNKFSKDNHPKADPDCALGVHTASNQHNEKKFEYYWGYKNHILVDCISGLPLYELTTPANVHDASVTEDILAGAAEVLPVDECTFIGDKAYDEKHVYNTVKDLYHGDAVIPINKRNTKDPQKLPVAAAVCVRNTAAPSASPNPGNALAIIRTGTTERKTGAVPNTNPFPMTIVFPLIAIACALNVSTLCVPSANDITLVSRPPDRNAFGFETETAPPISILLRILLPLRLPTLP